MEFNFGKVHPSNALIFFKLLFSSCLGFLGLFLINKELFLTLDIFRLRVLTIPLTMAVNFINSTVGFIILQRLIESLSEYDENIKRAILGGSFFPDFSFVSALAFYKLNVSHFGFDKVLLIIEGSTIGILFIIAIFGNIKKAKKTPTKDNQPDN